jgi:hypothetical protein
MAGQVPPAEVPAVGHGGASAQSSAETIPLAKQDPTTALFTSIGVFQSCLKGLGVTFVGAPNPSNPNSPANNPEYLKNLGTCAAQSNIVQALKAAQSAQDALTPAQIKKENRYYLKWRRCMISRGWGIPVPQPDSKGRLFSFGGGSTPNFKPPAGQNVLSSPDMQACASQVQQPAH